MIDFSIYNDCPDLIKNNLGWIYTIAVNHYKKRPRKDTTLDEVWQLALEGALLGSKSYDPKKGRESTYLTRCCSNHITRGICKMIEHGGESITYFTYQRYMNAVEQYQKGISVDKIAADMGIGVKTVNNYLEMYERSISSLDEIIYDERSRHEYIPSPYNVAEQYEEEQQEQCNKTLVKSLRSLLKGKQRKAIELFYGIGCTAQTINSIGSKLSVNQRQVYHLIETGLNVLREACL